MVMALDLRLDDREFDSRPPRLYNTGWVTVLGRANHRSISPATEANSASFFHLDEKCIPANMRLGSKVRMAHSMLINAWVAGKTV